MVSPSISSESPFECEELSHYPGLKSALEDPANAHLVASPGHHLNILSREGCLGEYRKLWLNRPVLLADHAWPNLTACSLPGLLPTPLAQASPGYFIRGEFLIVALIGNSPSCGYVPNNGRLRDAFKRELQLLAGKEILYRLTDVLPSDFFFLGERPANAVRGAAYLLQNRELLNESCGLIADMLEVGCSVTALVPNTSSPDDFTAIKDIINQAIPANPMLTIGLMVETEFASKNLHLFSGAAAFFPGPSDLIAEKREVGRGAYTGDMVGGGFLEEICADFLGGLQDLVCPRPIFTIKDMNNRLMTTPEVSRTYVSTSPERFLTPIEQQEILGVASVS